MPDYLLQDDFQRWCDDNADYFARLIPISETFGPTIQGEGEHMGKPCYFIRTGGCTLSCDWCDTPYSTGQHGIPLSTIPKKTVNDVLEEIPRNVMVIVTGGEPFMHLKTPAFQALMHGLKAKGNTIQVETNGQIVPPIGQTSLFDHITISPKIGVKQRNENHKPFLADWVSYPGSKSCKFVVDGLDTISGNDRRNHLHTRVEQWLDLAESHGFAHDEIWLMPEGELPDQINRHFTLIAETAANFGINISHRLHAIAWGNSKGH